MNDYTYWGNKHAVLTLKTAASEGIADIVGQAGAGRVVVDHFADRVEATGSGTGVVALVVPSTGKSPVTVGVDNTLGPAAGVRVSEVFWSTGALATRASHRSIGIWTTRVRVARIPWRGRSWGGKSLEMFLNRCLVILEKLTIHFYK